MLEVNIIRMVTNPSGKEVPLIDVESLRPYLEPAQKTETILALQSTVAVGHVADLVEVKTLEGREAIERPDTWVCKGSHNDPWVQDDEAIVAGYSYAGMEKPDDGRKPVWLTFKPRDDDNKISVFVEGYPHGFAIYGTWGENEEEDQDGFFPDSDKERFIQYSPGQDAYVVTRENTPIDWWIVGKDIYEDDYA
jgi:hypothetical protein